MTPLSPLMACLVSWPLNVQWPVLPFVTSRGSISLHFVLAGHLMPARSLFNGPSTITHHWNPWLLSLQPPQLSRCLSYKTPTCSSFLDGLIPPLFLHQQLPMLVVSQWVYFSHCFSQ